MLPAQPNQSLIDGLACLQALAGRGGPVGMRELARELKLEPTRVNRLLKTLASIGIARQDADRKYLPGPGMHVLSAAAMQGSGLIRRALPVLDRLRHPTLEVAMGVLWRAQVCYLYFAGPKTPAADALGGRGLFAAEQSGIGLTLLAAMSDDAIADLYADRPTADRERVLRDVAKARRQGFAYIPAGGGRRSSVVGVAVGDPAVAAIAIFGTFTADAVPELVARLKPAALDIAAGEARS